MDLVKTLSFLSDESARRAMLEKKGVPEQEWPELLEKSAKLRESSSESITPKEDDTSLPEIHLKKRITKKTDVVSSSKSAFVSQKVTVPAFLVNMLRAYELKLILSGSKQGRFSSPRIIVSSVMDFFKDHDKELYNQFKGFCDSYLKTN